MDIGHKTLVPVVESKPLAVNEAHTTTVTDNRFMETPAAGWQDCGIGDHCDDGVDTLFLQR